MKKSLFSILFVFTLFIGGKAASADEKTFGDYNEIAEKMRQDGALESDISSVITKLQNDEPLDSEKTSGEAVLFNYTELEMVNNPFAATAENPKKVNRYPDGSYNIVELDIENDEEAATPYSSGSFKTIKVTGKNALSNASYSARVYLNTHNGNNYIDKVYGKNIHTIAGTFSDDKLAISRKTENRSQKITAKSSLYFKYTNYKNMSAKTIYLRMHTGDSLKDRLGIRVSMTDGSASYK
ncbi:hypothetical protein ACT7C5_16470 [Bacillus pacificus]